MAGTIEEKIDELVRPLIEASDLIFVGCQIQRRTRQRSFADFY